VNIKEIKELVNLMNENNLVELEIEKEGMRVRLKKTSGGIEGGSSGPIIVEREKIQHSVQQSAPASAQSLPPSRAVEIKAPMVGTFYRAPAPEAAPFVENGQTIEPGQVICIIEAMKLMNEIKAEVRGKIIEILVDNAEPVEFGQPLFLIEPV
jgi:acetyl-CoA carboxylase biotin carboxyl carrier protein